MKVFLVLLSVATLAYSSPVPSDVSVSQSLIDKFLNCMNSDVSLCAKETALNVLERAGSARQLKIFDGLTIVNDEPRQARSLDTLSNVADVRKKQVSEMLQEKIDEILQHSVVEFSYGGQEESRALGAEESRKKKKDIKNKIKMLLPIALLLKAKLVVLAVFFLGVIAHSIWKLAIIAKIAFIAKIITLIKSLLAKKQQEDHGWAPAHEEHGHGGWESQGQGWGRSRNEATDMAYAAHKQQ